MTWLRIICSAIVLFTPCSPRFRTAVSHDVDTGTYVNRFKCHTLLAHRDEIIKLNLKEVEVVTILLFIEKTRYRRYDSRTDKLLK